MQNNKPTTNQNYRQKLKEISSWSHTFSSLIRLITRRQDTNLEALQEAFPKNRDQDNGNTPSTPNEQNYNKTFFVKLDAFISAIDALETANSNHDTATNAFTKWRTKRAIAQATRRYYRADKDFALEKIKQNEEIRDKVNKHAKDELTVLNSYFTGSALKNLKTKLNQEYPSPDSFYTAELIELYSIHKLYDSADLENDINQARGHFAPNDDEGTMSKSQTPPAEEIRNNIPKVIQHKIEEYKKNPQNQLRLAIRVSGYLEAHLEQEIKKHKDIILDLKSKKAELTANEQAAKLKNPKTRDIWGYIETKAYQAYYSISRGFKAPTSTETNTHQLEEQITSQNDTIQKHKTILTNLKRTKPTFPRFSDANKSDGFMEAVRQGVVHTQKHLRNLGLTTRLEQETYTSFNSLRQQDSRNQNDPFPLHTAVENADVSECENLLNQDTSLVNTKNSEDLTPLYIAAQKNSHMSTQNNLKIAKLLLEKGASIDDKFTSQQHSALHAAIANGNTSIAKLLLEEGASIDNKDADGNTPLHLAAYQMRSTAYHETFTLISKLLEDPLKAPQIQHIINSRNNEGKTLIELVADSSIEHAHKDILCAQLLENGAEVRMELTHNNDTLSSALFVHASATGNIKTMHQLLTQQSSILNTKSEISADTTENTALTKAIEGNQIAAVKLLLDQGTQANLTHLTLAKTKGIDEATITALGRSYEQSFLNAIRTSRIITSYIDRIVGRMQENGLDIGATDDEGNNVLHLCINNNNIYALIEFLKHASLHAIDINAKNNNGDTPLHLALGKDITIFKTVLAYSGPLSKEQIADINITVANDPEKKQALLDTQLMLAIDNNDLDEVKKLYHSGANINNTTTREQDSALHIAAGKGSLEILTYLVENYAVLEAKNEKRSTAFDITVQNNHVDAAKYLLTNRADIKNRDQNGHTPLYYALSLHNEQKEKHDYTDMVTLLLSNSADITPEGKLDESIKGINDALLEKCRKKIIEGKEGLIISTVAADPVNSSNLQTAAIPTTTPDSKYGQGAADTQGLTYL